MYCNSKMPYISCQKVCSLTSHTAIILHILSSNLLVQQFSNPMTEVCLLFYQSALQAFVHFKFLQREDPLIPILYDQIVAFLSKLARGFILVSDMKEAKGDFPSSHTKTGKVSIQVKFLCMSPQCMTSHNHHRGSGRQFLCLHFCVSHSHG